jgi:hypothetical protein
MIGAGIGGLGDFSLHFPCGPLCSFFDLSAFPILDYVQQYHYGNYIRTTGKKSSLLDR